MVDSAVCGKLVRGVVGRFWRIDRCGAVVPGSRNMIVTEGLISVVMTPNNDAGTTITVPNAAGKNLINAIPTPKFQSQTDAIALLGVDPELVRMLSNQETWEGVEAGEVTGFTIGDDIDPDEYGFGMELWSGTHGSVCDSGLPRFGYFLQPWVKGGVVDAITWANDAINFTITGATTQAPNQWGVGPADVTRDELGDPAPLRVALGERKHFLFDQVTLAPPEPVCGGQPVGTLATGITAGTPATLAPANSYPPYDLAALVAADLPATPSTAWTAGQYVELEDGTAAHWSGTAWVAGPA